MVAKISEPQPSFLIVTVICIVERRKKSVSPRFSRDREIWLPWQRDLTTSSIYRVGVRQGLWAAYTYPKFKGFPPPPPPETLTRNVSSSLGSLTLTAFTLTASFRVCSSVGDVELVDSKATDGLLRILACPFLDIGARSLCLV